MCKMYIIIWVNKIGIYLFSLKENLWEKYFYYSKEELTCDIGSTTVTVTVKNGKIISYIDKIEGDLDSEGIEQLNESYLKGITNNIDAINTLRDVIATMGGNCK